MIQAADLVSIIISMLTPAAGPSNRAYVTAPRVREKSLSPSNDRVAQGVIAGSVVVLVLVGLALLGWRLERRRRSRSGESPTDLARRAHRDGLDGR